MRVNVPEALWGEFAATLDRFGAAGTTADFWLRDDDAAAPSPALDRLLALADDAGAPIALAVIPRAAEAGLAPRLNALPNVTVLQHGYAHRNHAAPGAKASELGADRPVGGIVAELAEGAALLAAFSNRRPILVPPWNRIDPAVAARLPKLGFAGLSVYGDRRSARDAAGSVLLNTHFDPVFWRSGRGFIGEAAALADILARLRRIETGLADPAEPTGILTHHLVHDEATHAFLARLLRAISAHPACRWRSVRSMLADAVPCGEPA